MTGAPIDVLFIAGIGRCGSTLLSRLLGSIDGVDNLGEFASYWTNPVLAARDLPCGCGQALAACPRWESWTDGPLSDPDGALGRLTRNAGVFHPRPDRDGFLRNVGVQLADRYIRAADETGARLLIDASKRPHVALAASTDPRVRFHLTHMVRDPRAVTASRSTTKSYLRRMPAWSVGPRWSAVNLAVERVGRLTPPRVLIRYEDLVARPGNTVTNLLAAHGLDEFALPTIPPDGLDVGIQHSLAGNPDKLANTRVKLRSPSPPSLNRLDQALVTTATAPVRGRYGY